MCLHCLRNMLRVRACGPRPNINIEHQNMYLALDDLVIRNWSGGLFAILMGET